MNIPTVPNAAKGILFMITGTILLLNILGVTTELVRSIILFGSIGMIILGFFMADFHKRIYALIRKKKPTQNAPEQAQSHEPHHSSPSHEQQPPTPPHHEEHEPDASDTDNEDQF